MKKILLSISALIISLTLMSCGYKEVEVPPGVEVKTVWEFNTQEGLAAGDDGYYASWREFVDAIIDGVTINDKSCTSKLKDCAGFTYDESNLIAVENYLDGSHAVPFSVTSADGRTAKIQIIINKYDFTVGLIVSEFSGLPNYYYISKADNDGWDPLTTVKFSVNDNDDGSIPLSNVTISGDTVDVNTVGEYNVTYSVNNAAGLTSSKVVTVFVEENIKAANKRMDWNEFSRRDTLVIANGEGVQGNWFPGSGTGSAYDGNITGLIYGYGTLTADSSGTLLFNRNVLANAADLNDGIGIEFGEEYDFPMWDRATDTITMKSVRDVTYNFELNPLKFSSGEAITAYDYEFNMKLMSSFAYGKAGGINQSYLNVKGWDEWHYGCEIEMDSDYGNRFPQYYLPANNSEATESSDGYTKPARSKFEKVNFNNTWYKAAVKCIDGKTPENTNHNNLDFSGVNVTSNTTFSVTIKGEEADYYYRDSLASISPLSKNELTDGGRLDFNAQNTTTTVEDNQNIAEYVLNEYKRAEFTDGTGAYVIDPNWGYDGQGADDKIFKLYVNPKYMGNQFGDGAMINEYGERINGMSIQNIVIKQITTDLQPEAYNSGEIDILPDVVDRKTYLAITDNPNVDPSGYTHEGSYQRNGYGMISFHSDMPIMKYSEVKQAIAWLLDKENFIQNFIGSSGTNVHAPYGIETWQYRKAGLTVGETYQILENGQMVNYTYTDYGIYNTDSNGVRTIDSAASVAKAIELLESVGFTEVNSSCVRFNPDTGEELIVNWLPTTSEFTELLDQELGHNRFYNQESDCATSSAGIKIVRGQDANFSTLIQNYYEAYTLAPEQRTYEMFNLATGVGQNFDPYYQAHSDWLGSIYNTNQYANDDLDIIIENMRRTDSDDVYLQNWTQYMLHMNKHLPSLPLYSNVSYTFVNKAIKGFDISPTSSWQSSLPYMKIDER